MENAGDVLIVDDEKQISKLVQEILLGTGLFRNVMIASDGIEATQKLMNQKFSIVILDIKMPKKTGVDVLKEFKDEVGYNSPSSVIIVSGFLDQTIMSHAIKSGVKNFLTKPFDQGALITKVGEVLKSRGILQKIKK